MRDSKELQDLEINEAMAQAIRHIGTMPEEGTRDYAAALDIIRTQTEKLPDSKRAFVRHELTAHFDDYKDGTALRTALLRRQHAERVSHGAGTPAPVREWIM